MAVARLSCRIVAPRLGQQLVRRAMVGDGFLERYSCILRLGHEFLENYSCILRLGREFLEIHSGIC